jgi:putative solute:sodium symporter small subunit
LTEHAARDRHQLRTLILAVGILLSVLVTICVVAATATGLDHFRFLRFPLGFYLVAQGLLIGIAAAAFWFARAQDRIDRERDESEEY